MFKNVIIAALLIGILNMEEGWMVYGIARVLVSVFLVVNIAIIFSIIDYWIEDAKMQKKRR